MMVLMKQTTQKIMRKYIGKIMMQFFKSIWMRMRKTNGLAGNEVLVPMTPMAVEEKPVKPKRVVVRKKKDVNNT